MEIKMTAIRQSREFTESLPGADDEDLLTLRRVVTSANDTDITKLDNWLDAEWQRCIEVKCDENLVAIWQERWKIVREFRKVTQDEILKRNHRSALSHAVLQELLMSIDVELA